MKRNLYQRLAQLLYLESMDRIRREEPLALKDILKELGERMDTLVQ